jgi:hypothetical protein
MNKDLPIYDIVLKEDNQGVGVISLVDDPAIKVNWIKLAKQNPLMFKSDKEKQMLYGPFLIPNMLIYRFDEQNGEYYVRFSREEIEKIATKFNEDLNNKNINFMHTNEKVDAFVAENWLIESEQDKSKGLGFDLPEGSWFGGVKVKDSDFWKDKVKNEEVKGFSVEILADLELSLKNKEQIMKKQIKLGTAVLKGGVTVYWDGEFGMGTIIYVDEALTELAPDADHVLEDGTIVTTKDGAVVEIKVSAVEEDMRNLAEDGPCWEGYVQVGMKVVDGKEVPNCVPEEGVEPSNTDLAVEPGAPQAITAEEVSMMIDSRFAELMDEITNLKAALENKDKEMNSFRSEVNEKFSSVPATASIKKPETKIDDKFAKTEARIREFAKSYKK